MGNLLETDLKTLMHQWQALKAQGDALMITTQSALDQINQLKEARRIPVPPPVKAVPVPGPARPRPIAATHPPTPAPNPTGRVTETRTLAGFTLEPPPDGQRAVFPTKGAIAKRAMELGVSAEEVERTFPKGEKPTNATKLRFLEYLDGLATNGAATTAPVDGPRTLAGFTIEPAARGQRAVFPTKEAIAKKALELGMDAAKIEEYFPKGNKPTNAIKLKVLEQLDAMTGNGQVQASV